MPPGALVGVTLSCLDESGIDIDPLSVSDETVGDAPTDSVPIELPFVSGEVVPGATYGISVDMFAADGFPRLAGSAGNIAVDLAAGEAVVQLAPVAAVYAYLVDFPRHSEWAQTVEHLDLIRPGNASGVGARYLTTERQAMQADRRPYAPLRRGMVVTTLCEIRELIPQRRIAWHAHTVPRALGLSADLAFELSPEPDGGTRLTQHYVFHQPTLMRWMFRLRYGPDVDRKGHAQWEASLRNIKAILEAAPTLDSMASAAVAIGQR